MSPARRETFHIRSFELGPHGRASLEAVCDLLQEAASLHAHELGISPALLRPRGMTWYLARLDLRVERYPRWREAVTVETWLAEVDRLYAVRDFLLHDAAGEQLAAASTRWLLIDTAERKPIRRLPPEIHRLHPDPPRRVFAGAPERLQRQAPEVAQREAHLAIRHADLDLNGHVNSTVYVAQIAEALPGVLGQRDVVKLAIEHKAECRHGDAVHLATYGLAEGAWLHVWQSGGREVARARTRWGAAPPTGGKPLS